MLAVTISLSLVYHGNIPNHKSSYKYFYYLRDPSHQRCHNSLMQDSRSHYTNTLKAGKHNKTSELPATCDMC